MRAIYLQLICCHWKLILPQNPGAWAKLGYYRSGLQYSTFEIQYSAGLVYFGDLQLEKSTGTLAKY